MCLEHVKELLEHVKELHVNQLSDNIWVQNDNVNLSLLLPPLKIWLTYDFWQQLVWLYTCLHLFRFNYLTAVLMHCFEMSTLTVH